jgi:hypothetical protein
MSTQLIQISLTVIKCASDIVPVSFTNLALKAMAIVTDRLNANKPATPDPKTTRQANNKDLEVDLKKEEPSFFGSFFSSTKTQQQKAKKGAQAMEAVFRYFHLFLLVTSTQIFCVTVATAGHPPAGSAERARNARNRGHQCVGSPPH